MATALQTEKANTDNMLQNVGLSVKDVPKLVKNGFLPKTSDLLKRANISLRSLMAWECVSDEIGLMNANELLAIQGLFLAGKRRLFSRLNANGATYKASLGCVGYCSVTLTEFIAVGDEIYKASFNSQFSPDGNRYGVYFCHSSRWNATKKAIGIE